MLAKWMLLGVCAVAVTSAVGCGTAESADEGQGSSASADTDGTSGALLEKDIPLQPLSTPLSRTLEESLTRSGITVTSSLTASGVFGLKDGNVHVKVEYTANPPRITRLEISTRGTWTASARVDLDVKAGAEFTMPVDQRKTFLTGTSLGGKAFEITKVPLAILPLPLAPNLQLELDLELAAACDVDFDAELHAFAEVAVEGLAAADVFYDPTAAKHVGFVPNAGLSKDDLFHVTTPPRAAFKDGNLAQMHGRCGIQPSINATAALLVDPTGVVDTTHALADVGVKFVVEPYAQFDGTFNSTTDWSVDAKAAITGRIAPFGDFFGMPLNAPADFTLFDSELAKGPTSTSTSATPATDAPADPATPPAQED